MALNFLNNGYFGGKLGIGTDSPKQQLHVSGGTTAGDVTKMVIGATGGNAESYLYLAELFSGDNVNYGFAFVADGNSSNNLLFKRHSNSTSGTTVMEIRRDSDQIRFNGYSGTNQTGTPTYILGTTNGGDIVKVLGADIPGVPAGSGTLNTVAMWTPDGDTLGDSRFTQTSTSNQAKAPAGSGTRSFEALDSSGNSDFHVLGTGEVIIPSNYLFVSASQGAYFTGNLRARGGISNDLGTLQLLDNTNVTGNLTVVGDIITGAALLSNQENTDVDTGTETVANVAIATYTAAFFDFVIKKTTNVRSGTVYACHDGTNVEFTETSTQDLGDTSDVTLSVDISGGNMRLRATTTSDDWSVKSLIRAI